MSTLQPASSAGYPAPTKLLRTAAGWLARHIRSHLADPVLRLERGAVHRIRRPLGRTITCESGALWLTFDHHPIDVVLQAGESHRCTRTTLLLIQALETARLRPH